MPKHADDYGLNQKANSAITNLILKQQLESVSVIVTTPHFAEIAGSLKNLTIPIFLHANLTEGVPISDPKSIPSLVDKHGLFYRQDHFLWRCMKGLVSEAEVKVELHAQYELLAGSCAIYGIDSHQHAHSSEPLSRVLCALADEYSVCMRSYHHAVTLSWSAASIKLAYKAIGLMSGRLKKPESWKRSSWKDFVMNTWEPVSDDYKGLRVVHPGTDYDATSNLAVRIIRHFRHLRK